MKVLMVNSVCGIRSTGRICTDIATALEKQGHEVKIAYGRESVPKQYEKFNIKIGNDLDVKFHGLKSRLFDRTGFGSKNATKKFIKWVEEFDPDVIHLHNIHGYYINIELFFMYLKNCGKRIIWTLHDCWSFTGHCAYFDYANCDKWKTKCENCVQKKEYPSSCILDNSKRNYTDKKSLFTGIKNLTLVTPSRWLAGLVKESYMREYPVVVINNGIDTEIFKPTHSNFREKLNIEDKKVILGVAAIWDRRKGLDSFFELSKRIDDSYKIVLVGLSKKQMSEIPEQIIGIERTNSVRELAELYSVADIFVNPTLEDNYPTTNLEAIACGTPVITYNTGGSPESATLYGSVIQNNNVSELLNAIYSIGAFDNQKVDVSKEKFINEYLKVYNMYV